MPSEWLPGFIREDSKVLRSRRPPPDPATAARNLAENEARRPHWLKATEEKKSAFTPFPSMTEGPIYEEMKMDLPLPDSVKHERTLRLSEVLRREGYVPEPAALAGIIEAHPLVMDRGIVRLYRQALDKKEAFGIPLPSGSTREPLLQVTPAMRQGWGNLEFPFEVSATPYPPGSRRAALFEELAAYNRLHPEATAATAARAVGRSLSKVLRDIGSGAITLKKGTAKMELSELKKDQLVSVYNFLASKSTAEPKPTGVKGFKSGAIGQGKVQELLTAYVEAGNEADLDAIAKAAEKWGKTKGAAKFLAGPAKSDAAEGKAKKEPKEASTANRDADGYRIGSTRQKAWLFLKKNNFRVELKDLITHLYGSVEDGKSAINGVLRGFELDAERTGRTPEKEKVDGETFVALVQAS